MRLLDALADLGALSVLVVCGLVGGALAVRDLRAGEAFPGPFCRTVAAVAAAVMRRQLVVAERRAASAGVSLEGGQECVSSSSSSRS